MYIRLQYRSCTGHQRPQISLISKYTKKVYLNTFSEFVNQLTDDELTKAYFQQDGATCHTCNASRREIESYFVARLI
jgi:hypothetical protein